MIPEQNLWVAVIAAAIQEALKNVTRKDSNGEIKRHIDHTHILNAREWLSSNSDDFKLACHLAGLEPEYVQRKWFKIQKGMLNPKSYFTDRTY